MRQRERESRWHASTGTCWNPTWVTVTRTQLLLWYRTWVTREPYYWHCFLYPMLNRWILLTCRRSLRIIPAFKWPFARDCFLKNRTLSGKWKKDMLRNMKKDMKKQKGNPNDLFWKLKREHNLDSKAWLTNGWQNKRGLSKRPYHG